MLTVLIGMPRSGKSVYASKWELEEDRDNHLARVVLSQDKLRLALHGMRYVQSAEPVVHGIYSTMVRTLLMNPRLHILLDDTHTTVSAIRAVLNIDADAEFIYIHCDSEIAKQRAVNTKQSDLVPVIDRMYENLVSLCNYTSRKRGYGDMVNVPNEDDVLMSVEDIRQEVKKVKEYSDRSV